MPSMGHLRQLETGDGCDLCLSGSADNASPMPNSATQTTKVESHSTGRLMVPVESMKER